MLEVIEKALPSIVSGAVLLFLPWLGQMLLKADKDRRFNAEASRALLYDKLKHLCEKHIREEYLCIEDRRNLECLYQAYHDLKGNGFITGLYTQAMKLPLERK